MYSYKYVLEGYQSIYLEEMADIHFCSSVL